MSENRNRSACDFSKYDAMDTKELEAILRLDSETSEGQESDTELILYVTEVLADRRNTNNTGKTALEAWESFQQNYLPLEEECMEQTQQKAKPVKAARPWLRRLTAAAAVIALLIGLSVTASAFGWEDIWNAVAKWAKETFSFVSSDADFTEPSKQNGQQYKSLQEALDAAGLKDNIIPTWIPDGYTLEEIVVDENPIQSVYAAAYINGDKLLRIIVQSFVNSDPEKVEINEDLVEIYEASGVECYIFKNEQQLLAVWITDSYECFISGGLTMDEIKAMIDSIGKG